MLRRCLLSSFFLLFISHTIAHAADTLKVVNWNLEWFADGKTHNATTQTNGVRTIMQALNADVYALCEVVNIDSLESVVTSLPDSFGWYVSSYASLAPSPIDDNYNKAQKLGFVYRKSKVRNVTRAPMLAAGSSNAYYWFASGRYPFRVSCELRNNTGGWTPATFIVLHAKAMSDASSCYRRTEGAMELRDTLLSNYPDDAFLLLGDFNDDLDTSICSGGPSNYSSLVADSTNFVSLTLPISKAGAYSVPGYTSLIDHVIASNEMAEWYVPGSATVLKNTVTTLVSNYSNKVSDHYPVQTKYVVQSLPASTAIVQVSDTEPIRIWPQPSATLAHLQGPAGARYEVFDYTGRRLIAGMLDYRGMATLDVSRWATGQYVVALSRTGQPQMRSRLVVLR